MNEQQYASYRLRNGCGNARSDDRCSDSKKMKDAELRGSIGVRKANELIKSFDKLHSLR